jgi:pimeloyl-ACP methyl ester carboxylesterase
MNARNVLSTCSLIAVVGLASGFGPVTAQEATPTAAGVALPPDAQVAGLGLAEWSTRSWQWFFSFPQEVNPFSDDTGARCGYGQSGPVFFLAGAEHSLERSCAVPPGVYLFVPLAGSECSTIEPPPFFGRTEAELRRCATDAVDTAEGVLDMSTMRLTVDGADVRDLPAYRAVTPLFTLWLPEANVLGSAARTADSVADGYQVLLRPLAPGEHVVVIAIPGPQPGESVTITYRLTVVSGAYADQAGSPAATPVASPAAAGLTFDGRVDVGGGRTLHVSCAGTGGPPVLFEGGGPDAEGGTAVVAARGPDLAAALGTRVCAYDRAGTGQSAPDPVGVRTFREAAADLRAVLASPDLGCPCVVAGESLGGALALVALAQDATNFAGLVLLDPPYPGYLDEFLALAPAGSPEAALEVDPYMRGNNEERLDLAAGFRQVAAPAAAAEIPIVVVAHGAGDPPGCFPCSAGYPVAEMEAAWQAGKAELARALGGRLVVAEGIGHSIANENPGLVISMTAEVIAAVRDPSTWATPVASPTT